MGKTVNMKVAVQNGGGEELTKTSKHVQNSQAFETCFLVCIEIDELQWFSVNV